MSDSGAHLITVKVPFDTGTVRGEDHYWALKPPVEPVEILRQDGGENHPVKWDDATRPTPYYLFGAPQVPIYNIDAINGLRQLLDALEKEFNGE